jgi:hypothetical protein
MGCFFSAYLYLAYYQTLVVLYRLLAFVLTSGIVKKKTFNL